MSLRAIRALDDVILPCRDLAAARAFYRDILGFCLKEDTSQWVGFELGGRRLVLRPRGAWLAWNDGPLPQGSAAVQLAFRVARDDVDRAYEELCARQVDIVEAPLDQAFGHRTCFFRDSEGNVLEIYAEI